ncbi:MAG: DNA mismatch repair protein MutS [Mollicutes bacterium]|jgi:DNA mismatch repair protein MutS|nr:DNA mismatch repair protein MutS [Mollicutes bacterium]
MKRSEVDREKLSPMMKQYMDIKDQYPDVLLFFRLGDFYELFFEDGEIASRELELTLTGKSAGLEERIPMCGVPHHSVKGYLEKIIDKGYKVAICEQVEDPKTAKGVVKREVVQVISKGTIADLESLNSKDYNYIGSIIDYKHSYLITYADISAGKLMSLLINHDAEKLIDQIINLNIKEVVISQDFDLKITNILKNNYQIEISISNEYLGEVEESIIENLTDPKQIEGVKHLFYYLVKTQLKDLSNINDIEVINPYHYLELDSHTIRNLELVETIRNKERVHSLIWLLDKTKTAMGSRMLKDYLLRPLKDKKEIESRYDIIETFNTEFIHKENLRNALYQIYDIERLCGKLTNGSLNARDLLQIKKSLIILPTIDSLLKEMKLTFNIKTFPKLVDLLESSINEDAPITIREGHLIKRGYNSELDELVSIRSGGKEFIASLENSERERTGIKTLKVGFNKIFGYYIEISKGQAKDIKEEWGFERRQTLANAERFITPLLKEKEALVLNAEEKIIELEYELFTEIKNIIKEYIHDLKNVSREIAKIDALVSLSVVSEENGFIRPILSEDKELYIKDNRHPVVEKVIANQYVANDVIMDKDTTTLLITGPNMSGKSTYMRQVVISVILAQMGSFIPATEAKMPIFDKIFTRIGASDDLVGGESTFMVEMLEAKNAIINATENSLILFDELGRGTATYDGMSIAEAILEYVNLNTKCKVLFSTHYHELTDLSKRYKTIKNIHVKAHEENGNITFLHKIEDGPVDKSYGIHVASLAGMPKEIIERASEILSHYEKNGTKEHKPINEQMLFVFDEKKKDPVKEKLDEINPLEITPIEALNILYELKEKNK